MRALGEFGAANHAGEARGIASVRSAHPLVLEACVDRGAAGGDALPVEANCNRVNREGGYAGMRPAGLRTVVANLAAARGLPADRAILGGDRLDPT